MPTASDSYFTVPFSALHLIIFIFKRQTISAMLSLTYGRSSALLVALLSLVAASFSVGAFSGNATLVTPAASWDADIFHLPSSGKCSAMHECEGFGLRALTH